jgi:translation initiation factor IF-2
MAETVEKRKKVYKVATELNLSHETLVEFLRKKGHEVKSHMSTLDDDMMRDIQTHFKRASPRSISGRFRRSATAGRRWKRRSRKSWT